MTINLTKDDLEVSVDGCQVKNLDREHILRIYKDVSTEILEVDTFTFSTFCGKVS